MKQLYIILLLLSPFLSVTQELILSYPFSGDAMDKSGNQNDGMIVNATLTEDFDGIMDNAYQFNGINSYISAGEHESLEVDTALTIMACIKATGNGTTRAGGIIVNKEGEYSLARFEDGSLRFAIADENGWENHINTNFFIPLDQSMHVALTYSQSAGEIKLYVDSELVHTQSFSSNIGDNHVFQNELRIGGRQFSSQFFDGVIDEVRVYNYSIDEEEIRCALSTSTRDLINLDDLKLYPNPFIEGIYIKDGKESFFEKDAEILDLSGKVIGRYRINSGYIDLSNLVPGQYLLKVITLNGDRLFRKVIKI